MSTHARRLALVGATLAAAMLVLCPTTAAAPTQSPLCTGDDNDAAVINGFKQQGQTVSGCGDSKVKAQCGNQKIKQACCQTCGGGDSAPSPSPSPSPSPTTPAAGLKTQSAVTYVTAYGLPFKLDIVEPDTDEVLPLAVIVHGGGFIGGARIGNEKFAIDWANRGYRAINIDYPLCKHYWQGADKQQHPWGAASSLPATDIAAGGHSNCLPGSGFSEMPSWAHKYMLEAASRAVRHAIKWAHGRAAEGELKIDTANTVCHGSSAGSISCLDAFLFNTTISYANQMAPTEQATAGLPQQTNLLTPDPSLDYIKIAAHVGMSFGEQRNLTQETVDAMAPGASAWVIHDPKDDINDPNDPNFGGKTAGVRNLGTMLDAFGISNIMYVLGDPGMPRGPPDDPQAAKETQHGKKLEKTMQGDVLDDMHAFVIEGLASATRKPAPDAPVAPSPSPSPSTSPSPSAPTSPPSGPCTSDNDSKLVKMAKRYNVTVTGCADPKVAKASACADTRVAAICCATCATSNPTPANGTGTAASAPPKASSGNPFASAGGGAETSTPPAATTQPSDPSCASRRRGRRTIVVAAAALATAAAAMC